MRFLKTKVQEKTSEGNLYVLLKIHTYMTTWVYLQLWLWQPASPLATLMFNNNCEITGTLKASSKHCDSDFWCTKRKLHGCWFTECQSESLEDVCYKKWVMYGCVCQHLLDVAPCWLVILYMAETIFLLLEAMWDFLVLWHCCLWSHTELVSVAGRRVRLYVNKLRRKSFFSESLKWFAERIPEFNILTNGGFIGGSRISLNTVLVPAESSTSSSSPPQIHPKLWAPS